MAGEHTDPGKVSDLPRGIVETATKWTPETGDPDIAASFLLGWRVGVARDWARAGAHAPWPDDDPGLDDAGGRWAVLTGQIEAGAKHLTDASGLPALGDAPPQPGSPVVEAYRTKLLQRLYVAEHFRGLAFTLGWDLEALCAGADPEIAARIPVAKQQLLALATKLPPRAAHSVMNSLVLWEEQLT
jgi:hypothetical protein